MISPFKNLGLRLKIFLLLTASILIALLLASATFVLFSEYSQRERVKLELDRAAKIVAERVELVMAFEEEFGVEIPDDAAERILTVKDAVSFLEENAG